MKKVILISILSCSFLGSQAQDLRQLKEWAMSMFDQNKQYKIAVQRKDSIIAKQDTALVLRDTLIVSYQRDSVQWVGKDLAYKEKVELHVKKEGVLQKQLKEAIRQRNWVTATALILLLAGIGLAIAL